MDVQRAGGLILVVMPVFAFVLAPSASGGTPQSGVIYSCAARTTHDLLIKPGPQRCSTGQVKANWPTADVRGKRTVYGCAANTNGLLRTYTTDRPCARGQTKKRWRVLVDGSESIDIHACVQRRTHVTRLVEALQACKASEFRLAWPQLFNNSGS